MATIKDVYKEALDNGLINSAVDEQRFARLLGDDNERKEYFDYVESVSPGFYGNFDTFSNASRRLLSGDNAGTAAPSATDMPSNPKISANPAPTTEDEYQANLQRQWDDSTPREQLDIQTPANNRPYQNYSDEELQAMKDIDIARGERFINEQDKQLSKKKTFGERLANIFEPEKLRYSDVSTQEGSANGVNFGRVAAINDEMGRRVAERGLDAEISSAQIGRERTRRRLDSGRGDINDHSANYLYAKAEEILSAPSKFDGKTGAKSVGQGFKNFGEGLADNLFDRQFFATVDLQRNVRIGNLVEKLNSGDGLTESEAELLSAFITLQQANDLRANDLSLGYKIGQGAAESAPFMVDMLVTHGLSTVGKRGVLKAVEKKLGKEVAEKWAKRLVGAEGINIGTKTKPNVIGAADEIGKSEVKRYLAREAVETPLQTFAMPSSWANVYEEKANNMLENCDTDWSWKDWSRAWGNMYVETLTERAGGKLIEMGIDKVLPFGKIWSHKAGKTRTANDFIQSPIAETAEEYLGAGINYLRSYNPAFSDDSNKQMREEAEYMFTPEGAFQTFGTVLPMSLLGGAVNLSKTYHSAYSYNHARKKISDMLIKKGATTEQADNIMSTMEGAEDNDKYVEYINILRRNLIYLGYDREDVFNVVTNLEKTYYIYNLNVAELNAEFLKLTPEQQEQAKREMYGSYCQFLKSESMQENAEQVGYAVNVDTPSNIDDATLQAVNEMADISGVERDMLGELAQREPQDFQEAKLKRGISALIQADQQINPVTAPDGNIYNVHLYSDTEQRGNIIGLVDQNGDGSDSFSIIDDKGQLSFDKTNSAAGVIIRFDDGSVKQVPLTDVALEAYNSSDNERIGLASIIQSKNTFEQGMSVSVMDSNGNIQANAHVVSVQDDGSVLLDMQDTSTEQPIVISAADAVASLIPTEDLALSERQSGDGGVIFVDEDNKQYIFQETEDGFVQVNEQGQPVSNMSYTEEQLAKRGYTRVDGNAEPIINDKPIEDENKLTYPTDSNGEPDFAQMNVEQGTQVILDLLGGSKASAKSWVDGQIDSAKKIQLEMAKKKVPTNTPLTQFAAEQAKLEAEKQASVERVKYWQDISLTIQNHKLPEELAAEEEAKRKAAELRAQRAQTAVGSAGTDMAKRYQEAQKIEGLSGTKTTADGKVLNGRYMLISPNGITPSHDVTQNYAKSVGYPVNENGSSINDRDYQNDREEQDKVAQVAQNYNGLAINDMPIISDEGMVYSGNGRTMAGQLASINGTDKSYTDALVANATQFGFTPEQVTSIPNARLVFQLDERLPYNTTSLALFNQTKQQTQSNVAAAAANVRKMTEQARGHIIRNVNKFENVSQFFNDSKAPFELINLLISDGMISEREKAALVDQNGKLTPTGKDVLTTYLLGAAFSEETIRLMGDNHTLKNNVLNAIPQILTNKALGDYSLFDEINNAIKAMYEMKEKGLSYYEFARQLDIYGKRASDKFSELELLLAERMISDGVDAFRNQIAKYNNLSQDASAGQMDMFTGDIPTKQDIINQILGKYGKEQTTAGQEPAATETATPVAGNEENEQVDQRDTDELVDAARNGDISAQKELTSWGLKWGKPGVYRFVNKAEVDNILKGETYQGRFKGIGVDVTNSPDPTTAASAEYRITFNNNFDFYKDDGRTVMKNEELGDGWLRDGYSLQDVATIEKRNDDGTWTPIYKDGKLVENAHSKQAQESVDRVSVDGRESVEQKLDETTQKVNTDTVSQNTIFTEDAYQAAKDRMKKRLNHLNAGLDPEQLMDGIIIAGYHVEKGARKFADYAKAMIKDFGDAIRPYLKAFYNGLRDMPEAAQLSKDMDDYATVAAVDVNTFDKEEVISVNEKIEYNNGNTAEIRKQYDEIKEQYPNAMLVFRAGNFYEMYFDDAEEASKILGITNTKKGDMSMSGFPFHQLDTYLPKLVKAGKQVAICDLISDSKKQEDNKNNEKIDKFIADGRKFSFTYGEGNKRKVYIAKERNSYQVITKNEFDYAKEHGGKMVSEAEAKDIEDFAELLRLEDWWIKEYAPIGSGRDLGRTISATESSNNEQNKKNLPQLKRLQELRQKRREIQKRLVDYDEQEYGESNKYKVGDIVSWKGHKSEIIGINGDGTYQIRYDQTGFLPLTYMNATEEEFSSLNNAKKDENILPNEKKSVTLQPELNRDDYRTYMTDEAREFFANTEDGKKLAHPELAFISFASKDGVKIPLEELKRIPEIAAAQAKIEDKDGELVLSQDEIERYADKLLDSEHGSAELKENGKIKKDKNGNELFGGEVAQERKAFIVIGRPAGGKSSVYANPLSAKNKARIIDSDVVKEWLPGFDDGYGAGYVQQASSNVADRALEKAVANGDNIVYPKIGGGSILGIALALKRNGYNVELLFNEVSAESSYMRAMARFAETGRYLSTVMLEKVGEKPNITFEKYKLITIGELRNEKPELFRGIENDVPAGQNDAGRHGVHVTINQENARLFDYAEHKSNDVAIGEQPKLIWPLPDSPYSRNGGVINLSEVAKEKIEESKRARKEEIITTNTQDDGRNDIRRGSDSGNAERVGTRSIGGIDTGRGSEETRKDRSRNDRGGEERGNGERSISSGLELSSLPVRNTNNFSLQRGQDAAPTNERERFEANIAALRLLKQLEEDGATTATKEQQEVLSKFSGWGGLGSYFNEYGAFATQARMLRNLLTAEEYTAANMSRNSAYYTASTYTDAMWDIARKLSFNGGKFAENSAGIGNIIAHMPKDLSAKTDISAVEIDPITGGMLKYLYPDAKVEVTGFENVSIPNNSLDLVITNVPFVTGLRVRDKQERDLSDRFKDIHNFCIAKNIRKLKEGGIGIFISSNGTLDGSKDLRKWIVNEGNTDVIGAFRLNSDTFGGTDATSDIIVVRKRVDGAKSPYAINVEENKTEREALIDGKVKALSYNQYYVEHPENMGGKMGFAREHGDTRWGGETVRCYPDESINQIDRLNTWIQSLNEIKPTKNVEETTYEVPNDNQYEKVPKGTKVGELVVNSKGEVCTSTGLVAIPLEMNDNKVKGKTKAQCLKDYNTIKSALLELLNIESNTEDDTAIAPYIKKLNDAYDYFVNTYGYLNKNTSISFLRNDIDFTNIASLENYSEIPTKDGKKTVKVDKTDVFKNRVLGIKPKLNVTNTKDAVILSVRQFGKLDLDEISKWMDKDKQEIKKEILDLGLGFEDPATGLVVVSHEYLSGNVREKLKYAQGHNEDGKYDKNIDALEKVLPTTIPSAFITFQMGSTWFPTELYSRYVKEKFDLDDIKFTHVGNVWETNEVSRWSQNKDANIAAGVHSDMFNTDVTGFTIFCNAMNNKPTLVQQVRKEYVGIEQKQVTYTDKDATQAAATKADEMRDDFQEWARGIMQEDQELSDRIENIYNDRFNSIVPIEIGEEFMEETLDGMNPKIKLRPHQQQAVVRSTTQPVMLAHEVGTGKTYTLIASAMEMRRLGTAKKPMIVVQNSTVGQFVSSAKSMYPKAKILTVNSKDRTAEGRKEFYAKIKYNDWDLIIIPQSVFDMIPDSEERMRDFVQEKIDEKIETIQNAKEANLDRTIVQKMERELVKLEEDKEFANISGKSSVKKKDDKKIEVMKQNTTIKAEDMVDRKVDNTEDFDTMGIDALLIDEAHNYKHLGFTTTMQRGVKGVDPSYSKRAASLYLKCQSVFDKSGHKNVVFATGTPISNTAAEIWTFMKYLYPKQVMKDNDIYYFDDFVHNFGRITQSLEFTTSGKFKENSRFASYMNLPELARMWSNVAHTILTKEVQAVNDQVPDIEGGKAKDVFLPQSKTLVGIMKYVKKELDRFEKMSGAEKREQSYIPLVMYGIAKRAAIDPRLVAEDAIDEPNSKTNNAVDYILKALNDSKSYNGTAALFCDNYRRLTEIDGKKVETFNIFNDIKEKLIKKGVPAEQIVIMSSSISVDKKERIFDDVNSGRVRVIMGTTDTLGTGVNIQERLFEVIHMDAPDRPMDYTQRNGRILRQGNMHKQWGIPVRVIRFGVEDSLDVTGYQRLKTKSEFIDSIMESKKLLKNNLEGRNIEEPEEGLFDNPVAVLSGSQYAMLKSQAEREYRKLQSKKNDHERQQIQIINRTRNNDKEIMRLTASTQQKEKMVAMVNEKFPNGKINSMYIDGQSATTEEKKKIALKDVRSKLNKMSDAILKDYSIRDNEGKELNVTVSINGVDFVVKFDFRKERVYSGGSTKIEIKKKVTYSCKELELNPTITDNNKTSIDGAIEDIINNIVSNKIPKENLYYTNKAIERLTKENADMAKRKGLPFKEDNALEEARKKVEEYTELMRKEMQEKEDKYSDAESNDVTLDTEVIEEDDINNRNSFGENEYQISGLTILAKQYWKEDVTKLIERIELPFDKVVFSRESIINGDLSELENKGLTDVDVQGVVKHVSNNDKVRAFFNSFTGKVYIIWDAYNSLYDVENDLLYHESIHEYISKNADAKETIEDMAWMFDTDELMFDLLSLGGNVAYAGSTKKTLAEEIITHANVLSKKDGRSIDDVLSNLTVSIYAKKIKDIIYGNEKRIEDYQSQTREQRVSGRSDQRGIRTNDANRLFGQKRQLGKSWDGLVGRSQDIGWEAEPRVEGESIQEYARKVAESYAKFKKLNSEDLSNDTEAKQLATDAIVSLLDNVVLEDDDSSSGSSANAIFNNELEKYENGELNRNEYITVPRVGKMNNYIPNDKDVIILQSILSKAKNKHDIELESLKNLPNHLGDPVLLFRSKKEDSKVAVIDSTDKNGNPIIVAIKFNSNVNNIIINEIRSIHGRENLEDFARWYEENLLEDGNIKKYQTWLKSLQGYNSPGVSKTTFDKIAAKLQEISETSKSFDEKNENLEENVQQEYQIVTEPTLLEWLNNQDTITVYRAMQLVDGKLYPPMAAVIDGKRVEPIELGVWEKAVERPDLVKDGKFILNKGSKLSKSVVPAAYNPYIHTSRSPLNDQFKSAWNRPELVTIETEIPKSELTSGYKADGAKDAVGEVSWKSGSVSSKLAKVGKERKVILSRYDKPIRILPTSEVADKIAQLLNGEDIEIPVNTINEELRNELEKRGVKIGVPEKGMGERVELQDKQGVIYGWYENGNIHIIKDLINPNTPIHEYTHMWARAMMNKNPEAWKSILKVMKDTPFWNEVVNDSNYNLTNDDDICSEVLARYSGRRGAQLFTEKAQEVLDEERKNGDISKFAKMASVINKVKDAITKFWKWVGQDLFKIKNFSSSEEIADRILYDMINKTDLGPRDPNGGGRREQQIAPEREDNESIQDYAARVKQFYQMQKTEEAVRDYNKFMNEQAGKKARAYHDTFDAAAPIEYFQKFMVERGAILNADNNAYQDMFLATGRISTFSERYNKNELRNMTNAIRSIIDSHKLDGLHMTWQNMEDAEGNLLEDVNGKELTPQEILGVYAQAKDCEEAVLLGLPDRGQAGFIKNLGKTYKEVINDVENALTTMQLRDFWKSVNAATKFALKYELDGGFISQEVYDSYAGRDFYVPQRGWVERDLDGENTEYIENSGTYNAPYNAALKKSKGRNSLASQPFAYIESIAESAISSTEQNKTKQKLLQFFKDNEQIGLETGAFHFSKFYVRHVFDGNGNVMYDADGQPKVEIVYSEPSAEDIAHDEQLYDEIKKLRKQINKYNNALETATNPVVQKSIEDKINSLSKEIQQKHDNMIIARGVKLDGLQHRTYSEQMQHAVNVIVDGENYVLWVRDERLANAINRAYKKNQRELLNIERGMRNGTRYLSAALTQYNPEFAFSNFFRDAQVALVSLSVEHPELVASATKHFFAALPAVTAYAAADKVAERDKFIKNKYGKYLDEYYQAGAQTGYSYLKDLETIRKDFNGMLKDNTVKKGVRATIGVFSMLTEISETAVRFAAYVAAREKGMSVNDAAYISKELTTNFDREGAKIGDISAYFSFLRATLNGNLKFYKAFKNHPFGYSVVAVAFLAMGILAQLMNPDDPEKEIYVSDYKRMSDFVFGKVHVPVAHFMRMFYSLGVNMMAAIDGSKRKEEAIFDALTFAADEQLPNFANISKMLEYDNATGQVKISLDNYIQNSTPSMLSPIVDVWLNRDFTGAPLNGEKYEYPGTEYKKDVSRYSKKTPSGYINAANYVYSLFGNDKTNTNLSDNTLAHILDISPSTYQHIIEGYEPAIASTIGITAQTIESAIKGEEWYASDVMFLRRFYSSYKPDRVQASEYWELNARSKAFKQMMKDLEKTDREEYLKMRNSEEYRIYEEASRTIKRINPKEHAKKDNIVKLMDLNNRWNKVN